MSSLRQYLHNIAALIGQSTVQRLFGMVTTVLLARLLGVVGFGAYSAIINISNSAYGMVRLGVDASIHVHTAEADQGENSLKDKGGMLGAGLLLLIGAGVFGATASLILNEWLAMTVYGQPELARWMVFAAGLVLLQCLSQFCFTALAGLHEFVKYSQIMVISAALTTLAVSSGAYTIGINGALAGMLGVQIIIVFLLARSARGALHAEGIVLRFVAIKHWHVRHLRFGFPFYASGLLSAPVALYLQGMLSRHAGLEALGEVRVIIAILSLVSFIPSAASSAMISQLTTTSTIDYSTFIHQSLLHIKYIWLFALFAGLGVFLMLPFIIKVFFGAAYMGAVAPASYAILTTIISCILSFVSNIILARRRVGLILAQSSCQVSAFACAAFILIPKAGLSGYLLAELIGWIAGFLLICFPAFFWKKRHSINIPWLAPLVMLSFTNGMGLLLLSLHSLERYRAIGVVLLTGITALSSSLYIFSKEERLVLFSKLSYSFKSIFRLFP